MRYGGGFREEAVELAPEEVARLRRREAAHAADERAAPVRAQVDVPHELGEIEGARVLRPGDRRLLVDGDRDGRVQAVDLVAAVRVRVGEPEGPQQRFTRAEPPLVEPPTRTSRVFAARLSECTSAARRRSSSGAPCGGGPPSDRNASTAIASLSVDAAGNLARAFHAAPSPVTASRTYAAAMLGKRRTRRAVERSSAGSRRAAPSRGRAASGSPNTGRSGAELRRAPLEAIETTRIAVSRRGEGDMEDDPRAPMRPQRGARRAADDDQGPRGALREQRDDPSERDLVGAGCTIRGAADAAGGVAAASPITRSA